MIQGLWETKCWNQAGYVTGRYVRSCATVYDFPLRQIQLATE